MSRTIAACLALTLTLAGCGGVRDSRLNPFNWFGNDRPAPVRVEAGEKNPLIPQERTGLLAQARARDAIYTGQPVDVVKSMAIERVPGGAIIRAIGVSRYQNTYGVRLTLASEDGAENGVLEYRLESIVPEKPIAGGSERQREIIAALSITDQQLEGVRRIRISGATNARESSRR